MNVRFFKLIALLIFTLGFTSILSLVNAQITIGSTEKPHQSAALELKSTNKGLLIPRVELKGATDIETVPDPAHSLIVYNLTDGNNGTPLDTSDDVYANNLYIFSKTTTPSRWTLLVSDIFLTEKLADIGVPQLVLSASVEASGNNTNFLSPAHSSPGNDASANIRTMYFGRKIYDPNNAYDPNTSEFTAFRNGYYNIEVHILLRSYQIQYQVENKVNRLGVSKPYNGNFIYEGNASFAILNQPINPVTHKDLPLTISVSGIIYMEKDQKIRVLTRYITPGTSAGNNIYSLNTESTLGVKREEVNKISITYYPTK